MSEPITRNCNRPQLVSLPAALIAPGLNALDLKVVGHALPLVASRHRAGALSALEIGPQSLLYGKYERQLALNVTLPQALSATLLLMGGFMFVLGWINRRESHLAYFGALSIGWALVESRLWLRNLPFDNAVAELLLCSLLPLLTWASVQFLLRYAQYRHRWIDIALPLAERGDAGEPDAGGPAAPVRDGQLLVRAAGAADAGGGRVLPAHAVPRAQALVLADGVAAVHRDRGAGGGVRGAEVRHPRRC